MAENCSLFCQAVISNNPPILNLLFEFSPVFIAVRIEKCLIA
jgi:hypothetical protein